MIKKYQKKPVEVEAVQWTGSNLKEVCDFIGKEYDISKSGELYLKTLEGTHHASIGDYIIKGVQGEFYPCKPDIFEQTYDPAEPPQPPEWQKMMYRKFTHGREMDEKGASINRNGGNK